MMFRWVLCVSVASVLFAAPARAHEVLHEVERSGAVAVRAYFADGNPLAYATYQLFSPTDAAIPYQKGRTDRAGYLAFVPNVAGRWRLELADNTGHGLDTTIEVASTGRSVAGRVGPQRSLSTWAFVLRPLLGLMTIALIFAVLVWTHRRRAARPT